MPESPELVRPDPALLAHFPLSHQPRSRCQISPDGKNMFGNIVGWDDDEAALVVVIPCRDPGHVNVTVDVRN